MSTTIYGLTSAGFVAKPQSQIVLEIQTALQAVFGQNVNLGPESNLGQLVGIISEREALIWQLAEAVYASQYPGGAEGTSVDNILALNNLRRLPASPTRTSQNTLTQTNGITLFGLVLFGTPGTLIPAGSIIQTNQTPALQFTLDSPVVIGSAVNAVQSLFRSNTPTTGTFSLSIVDPAGNTLTTEAIEWDALAATTQLLFSAVPSTGAFTLSLTALGATLTTGSIPYTATASQVQTAIQALSGYGSATVSGNFTSGFQVVWAGANPSVSFATNTLGVTASAVDSVQAAINTLHDSSAANYPYTDVVVSVNASGFNFNFGAGTVLAGQPVSSAQAEALFTVISNSLMNGSTVTNLQISNSAQGAPAQVAGSATCTQTGPNFVAAGSLNTIGSSISGWTGVTNQLDCISGTNVENDTQALIRRQNDLQAQANGPLQSIIEKVSQIADVTTVIGFENMNEAALQTITFPIAPSSGAFQLVVNGIPTTSIPYNATASQVQTAIRTVSGFSATNVTGDIAAGFTVDFNGSLGGQPLPLMGVENNTTAVSIVLGFGRPGKSFEIVVEGGDDTTIAQTILASKPAGIQTYGSTSVQVFDSYGNGYKISFSRPTQVPFYVVINMVTDLTSLNPKFNPQTISTIQEDVANLGNAAGIGGLVIGFGTNGIIGAFNNVPGIISYTLSFGRAPNPTTNTNVQLQPEEAPNFETFNIQVSYS